MEARRTFSKIWPTRSSCSRYKNHLRRSQLFTHTTSHQFDSYLFHESFCALHTLSSHPHQQPDLPHTPPTHADTMAPAIGIDLGTTYSCVGIFRDDRIEIIANDQGNRTTPSFVAFTDTERLIGDSAKNQVAMNPVNTVFDAKRLIGRKFNDPEVQADMKH